eukprot:753925-Hanusia_phi.AAC.9
MNPVFGHSEDPLTSLTLVPHPSCQDSTPGVHVSGIDCSQGCGGWGYPNQGPPLPTEFVERPLNASRRPEESAAANGQWRREKQWRRTLDVQRTATEQTELSECCYLKMGLE